MRSRAGRADRGGHRFVGFPERHGLSRSSLAPRGLAPGRAPYQLFRRDWTSESFRVCLPRTKRRRSANCSVIPRFSRDAPTETFIHTVPGFVKLTKAESASVLGPDHGVETRLPSTLMAARSRGGRALVRGAAAATPALALAGAEGPARPLDRGGDQSPRPPRPSRSRADIWAA